MNYYWFKRQEILQKAKEKYQEVVQYKIIFCFFLNIKMREKTLKI